MYDKIYDFCKAKNSGIIYTNGHEPTPRVKFITNLLEELGIQYEIDSFPVDSDNTGFNVILRGTSDRMITAHHDIVNPEIDNANDNSASVINAIATKMLVPELHVVLLDGEEVGGLGSSRLSESIVNGDFGKISWILNLELTGRGGSKFFIGDYPGPLSDHIRGIFECPIISTPFNDSVIFRANGIDSVVINPLPVLNEGTSQVAWGDEYLDISILRNCHRPVDSLDKIRIEDMKEFVEEVIVPIVVN